MRLNKKGFTLIELIVTIVLMLSLTILVIVGFTNISDEKKLEADKLTENQIITAAEQYFSSNYYLVNTLKKDKNAKIFVNLAKLVEDDYLNVTTKTSTEEKYNSCDIVYADYSKSYVEFKYINYTEVFNYSNRAVFGYTGSEEGYEGYLATLGFDKTNNQCGSSVLTLSDISATITIDRDYLTKNKIDLKYGTINSVSWYNQKVPVLISIISKDGDSNPQNAIDKLSIKVNNAPADAVTELEGNTSTSKKFRIMVDQNGVNKVDVSAFTLGGKTADASSTYHIDKETPKIEMVAYKTNDTSITSKMPSLTSIATADKIDNDTWVNASGKKNVYLFIQVKDGYSGVSSSKFSCIRKSDDGADANNDTLSSDNKTYKKLYFYNNDKISTYECEGFDIAGNSSGKKTFTVKRDVTLPEILIVGYKADESVIKDINTTDDLNKKINSLSSYTKNTWTKDSVVVKSQAGDNLSGIKSYNCTDSRKSGSKYDDFSIWRRVYKDYEGTVTFNCSITDKAGNENDSSFVVKRDITKPSIPIAGYKASESVIEGINTLDDLNNKSKDLDSYTKDTWTKDSIVVRSQPSDTLSGVKSYNCTDSRKSGSKYSDFSIWRRVYKDYEGSVTFKCSIKDNAGNENDSSFVVKRDITPPEISGFKVSSLKVSDISKTTSNYKSYKVRLEWDSKDDYTYIDKVKTSVANNQGTNEWDVSDNEVKEYTFKSEKSYFKASNSFDGTKKTFKVKACDILGNCSDWNEKSYTVTDLSCDVTKNSVGCMSKFDNQISGQVTVKCNAPVDNITVVYTYGTYGDKVVKVCNENVVTPENLNGEENKAVFNFRGCDGYYTFNRLTIGVNGTWDSDKADWSKSPVIKKTAKSFKLNGSNDTTSACNPERGGYTDY